MDRLNFRTLILLAVAVGLIFEFVKHSKWPSMGNGLKIERGQAEVPKPYSRKIVETVDSQIQPYQARAFRGNVLQAVQLKPTRTAVAGGQMDSHVPAQAAAPQTPSTAAKKVAKAAKVKKCRPKGEPSVGKGMPMPSAELAAKALASPDGAKLLAQQQTPSAESQLEECPEEDPNAAKKEELAKNKTEEEKPEAKDESPPMTADTIIISTTSGGLTISTPEPDVIPGLEEWKKRLLTQPDLAEVVRLIEYAQTRQISSELFYTLVRLMLKDPRLPIQELGVLAAGRTPSTESFMLLIGVLKTENIGSPLRLKAETELEIYQQPRFLPIVAQILRSTNDSFASIWGAKEIAESAQTYLTAKYNRPPAGTTTTNTTTTVRNPYVSLYKGFLTLLQTIATHGDPEEAAQARSTLLILQNLLKNFA
jgi:hypothetical protein